MKRLLMGVAALCLSVGVASAQSPEKIAEHFFEKGNTAYNLGRWDEAAGHFTKAYEAWAQPEFLYNIAQSYRQGGNCKQALHFYRRFKSLKEDDKKSPLSKQKRDEIDKFIKQLTDCAAKADSSAGAKPDTIDRPTGSPPTTTTTTTVTPPPPTTTTTTPVVTPPPPTTTTTTPVKTTPPPPVKTTTTTTTPPKTTGGLEDPNEEEEEEVEEEEVTTVTATSGDRPKMVSARVVTGISLLSSGDLEMPVQPAFAIVGGYPLPAGPVTLELGAGLSYTPLPYEVMGEQKRGTMLGARAVVGATYPVAPKIIARGDLGLGMVALSGLEMGNPLVEDFSAKAFTLFSVRVGVSADYLITPNIAATLQPFAISFSPGGDGMYGSSLREINVLVGVGYRQ